MNSPEAHIVDVRFEKRASGHVAYVTVNNPKHRNRLGTAGKDQLIAAFAGLAKDDELRVAVLTGAGDKSFISGSDLAEMKDLDAGGQIEVSICAAGARAIRLQKALVQDWERMSIKDAMQRGIAAMGESRSTDEPVRLMQAFIDRKRNS